MGNLLGEFDSIILVKSITFSILLYKDILLGKYLTLLLLDIIFSTSTQLLYSSRNGWLDVTYFSILFNPPFIGIALLDSCENALITLL